MRYRIKYYKSSIKRFLKTPYWWYQRIVRGYSDKDMWNADRYLARIYAGTLIWYVHKGMGVPSVYADNWDTDIEIMEQRRNIEYYKYADIFRRYAKEGVWDTPEHVKEFGGVLDKELEEALQWLSKHFQELWD
jgi:hypothetical protein